MTRAFAFFFAAALLAACGGGSSTAPGQGPVGTTSPDGPPAGTGPAASQDPSQALTPTDPIASNPPSSPPSDPPAGTPGPVPTPLPVLNPPPPPVSAGLRVSTRYGIYLLDPPMTNEPPFDGFVRVDFNGAAPPPDTTVELNGVPMVRDTAGNLAADRYWKLTPGAAQPAADPNGWVTITARSGSQVGTLTLQCPADIGVTSSTSPGGSLASAGSLQLGWISDLWFNPENVLTSDYYANVHLRSMNAATNTLDEHPLDNQLLPRGTLLANLAVPPISSTGYVAELRWQGGFVKDAAGEGFCGRVKRILYSR